MNATDPHWEHGYRTHGFWLDEFRIGRVSIGHGKVPAAGGYRWEFTPTRKEGVADTLRQAKKAVAECHADWVSTGGSRAELVAALKAWK